MAATTSISVEEYLKTVYSPDCDYVDGVVEERNLGEFDHGYTQSNVAAAIKLRSKQTGLVAITEWRFQITPTRFRIPDVVITRGRPNEKILTHPPLACVEILSPEDRMPRVEARIKEYLDFGVPAVWLIDPETKSVTIYRCNSTEQVTGPAAHIDGTDADIPLDEIFD